MFTVSINVFLSSVLLSFFFLKGLKTKIYEASDKERSGFAQQANLHNNRRRASKITKSWKWLRRRKSINARCF